MALHSGLTSHTRPLCSFLHLNEGGNGLEKGDFQNSPWQFVCNSRITACEQSARASMTGRVQRLNRLI